MTSFKDELARYDAKLIRATEDYLARYDQHAKYKVKLKRNPDAKLTTTRAHVDRWMKDNRAQKVWTIIKNKAPALEAQEFIRTILKARSNAVGLVNRIAHHNGKYEYWKKRYSKEASELRTTKLPLEEIAERLEAMASDLRDLAEFRAYDIADDLKVSRQDLNGSRAMKLFVQSVSILIHEISGERRYGELATLTEIAFPSHKLDIEKIRDLLRQPSTRRKQAAKSARR
jgi:hypothetical protein